MCKYLQRNFTKKKTDLIEIIFYECITEKLDKKKIDISIKQANQILNKKQYKSKVITCTWKCGIKKKRN